MGTKAHAAALAAIAIAILGVAETARADEMRECATAYEQTQRLQQKGEVVGALDAADRCARPTCPLLLKDECTKWATELKPKLATLVLRVRGADSCPLAEASVSLDRPSRKGDGGALLVDPGVHEVRVVDPGTSQAKRQTINFAAGEKRDIDVDFGRPGGVCTPPSPLARIPTLTLVLGTVGIGLLAVGVGSGVVGAVKRGDLDECKSRCSQDRIDAVKPFFLAGDIVGGVGAVAIAAAAISYFVLGPAPKTTTGLFLGPAGVGATF